MDKKHIKQIQNMLKQYGAVPVITTIAKTMMEDCEIYPKGAIIHEYTPIVCDASRKLEWCKYNRLATSLLASYETQK